VAKGKRLFATRWVHAFEEDTPEGAVYRPEGSTLPLSRRPREGLELDADGTARIYRPGPDDRAVAQPASWRDENGAVVVRAHEGGAELRLVEHSPERLVIQVERKG
jgi:hypothetical protein